MDSEPSTSTSEIQTDTSEFRAFPTRSTCIKLSLKSRDFNYPQQNSETQSLQEEAVLVSGEYLIQKKQTDSRAGQGSQSKQVTMQDQATSPIVIEDDASDDNDDERTPDASNRSPIGNDSQDSATNDENNTAQSRPLRRSPRHSSRQSVTSGNNTREHNILQGLLQELSTPVRGESIENNEVAEDDSETSMPKNLARLFQKACRAETRATKSIQEEISCWYYYGKAYEERLEEIKRGVRINQQEIKCMMIQWSISQAGLLRTLCVKKLKGL
ncbi:hypothetical protein C1645_830312 [Glomus cerebriforme]|uniref:Uncharacterized protein n=1 Tax=Glomus cerebriforme TaxID=658196 RepID=A0A397SSD3_9GLOM|nr:hypothetical protein C1645_830312 [Glomus cerebriforme]